MTDNITVLDSTGATVTLKSKDTGSGVQAPNHIPTDDTGAPYSTTNPLPAAALTTTGVVQAGTAQLTPKFAKIAASSSGVNSIVALVSGKKIRVLAYNFTGAGAVNAKWQSNTTDLSGLTYIAASGYGKVAGFNPLGWLETAAGEALNLNLSAAVAVGGEVVYVEV